MKMDPREKKRQQREEHRQEVEGQKHGGAKGTKKEKPKCEIVRKNDGTNDTKFSQLKTPKRRERARIKPTENTFESVLMRWMKLEPIIQSEVSQKEKHLYSILTHIYGI